MRNAESGMRNSVWETRRLGELCDIQLGKMLDAANTVGEECPYITNKDVQWDGVHVDDLRTMFMTAEDKAKFSLRKGDLLVCEGGEIGRCAIWNEEREGCYFQKTIHRVRTKDKTRLILPYLKIILSDYAMRGVFTGVAAQTSIAHLPKEKFEQVEIPVPSLTEQRRIAEVLGDTDALIANLEKRIAKRKLVKQGMMQNLLSGKVRLQGFSNPWETKCFGDMVSIARGGSPRPIEAYLTKSADGINWIKIGDVAVDAKYIRSTEEKIIADGALMSRRVSAGDFLLSNSMSFGRPYILQIDGCIHDGWLTIQNYSDYFDREFLYYILSSEYVVEQYKALASGSSVKNLNKEIVARVMIPTPQIDEQRAIAAVLTDMDSEIAVLEKKAEKYRQLKRGMMSELLTGKVRLEVG